MTHLGAEGGAAPSDIPRQGHAPGPEELFELELVGGALERRYRAMRPEVEEMPWGTLAGSELPDDLRRAARQAWTGAAFQEYRTGAACAATLRSLIEARAPLDLIALASRFPLDEIVHVELCSRIAMELGGAVPWSYDPEALIGDLGADDPPLLRACHQVVAYFCVGEALSIPLLHGTWKAATHPLTKAVLKRIVLDEADHGSFGWAFLDWVAPHLDAADRAALGRTAAAAVAGVEANQARLRSTEGELLRGSSRGSGASGAYVSDLGWMQTEAYLALADQSLQRHVLAPLRQRGICP